MALNFVVQTFLAVVVRSIAQIALEGKINVVFLQMFQKSFSVAEVHTALPAVGDLVNVVVVTFGVESSFWGAWRVKQQI